MKNGNQTNGTANGSISADSLQTIDLMPFMEEIKNRLVTVGSFELPQAPEQPVKVSERWQNLVFKVGDIHFGLDVSHINEVIQQYELSRVPGVPEWILGITNWHGNIVSVIDMARFLNIEGRPESAEYNLLITHAEDQIIGLKVNEVEMIYSFPVEEVLSPPFAISHELVAYLRGVVDHQNEFVRLLDCSALLLGQQMQIFS